MNILYLAHNLDDSAIWRRVAMLQRGGATIAVAGFRRGVGALAQQAVVLGQTHNSKLLERAGTVLRTLPRIADKLTQAGVPDPDVIIARNLEMLVLGRALLRRYPAARLVYELLDVHRLMLGSSFASRALRQVEGYLMRHCALVLISSPGFEDMYLRPNFSRVPPTMLIENKPFATPDLRLDRAPARTPGGPIVIGWSGILRCAWSLEELDRITRAAPGRYRVLLRGKPALDVVPEFHKIVAANPDMTFGGAYQWPRDLAEVYGPCDLSWLIDRYEADGNSEWLLPNRLYEGGLFGAVPIALASNQLGRRLVALDCGLLAADPEAVQPMLAALTPEDIERARAEVTGLPRSTWLADDEDCRALTDAIARAHLRPGRSRQDNAEEVIS